MYMNVHVHAQCTFVSDLNTFVHARTCTVHALADVHTTDQTLKKDRATQHTTDLTMPKNIELLHA